MATVHPIRSNTNSTGSSTSHRTRQPSLSSFPSSKRSTSQSTQNGTSHTRQLSSTSHSSSAVSYHSSVSASLDNTNAPANKQELPALPKRIKSQYPANSSEKHVEYILVASFDIDRGSIMEHQYPGPVGGDEVMLAELMLPDQTHLRKQDWTIFFLHKDAEAEEEEEGGKKKRKRRKSRTGREDGDEQAEGGAEDGETEEDEDGDDMSDEEDEEGDGVGEPANLDGPPLVYVLNLVNTKTDTTVKRGAIVKAMAICTRHSFLHIYKPLLLLALEQYFANPLVETLASLYDAVNSMDLSLMPQLSFHEKFILQASDVKDMFIEKFEAVIAQRMAASASGEDASQKSGSSALQQVPSRNPWGLPRDTHEFESVINYSNIPIPVKVPVALAPETVGDFSLIKLITTFSTPHTASPVPFTPTHPHLTTSGPNTHPVIVLLNALLTQKRIIFLGHNLPSSEVAEAVLGACALASGGLLRGFTRHAFPYTDLTKIDDLLRVPGFIAGVTNPAFAHKTEWWDVLCDISTGRMRISNKIEQAPLSEGVVFFQQNGGINGSGGGPSAGISAIAAAGASLSAGLGGSTAPIGSLSGDPTGDAAFMQNVLGAINDHHGENAIRTKFRLWVSKFARLAATFEEAVYGASALHIHDPTSGGSPKAPFTSADGNPMSPTVESPLSPSSTRKAVADALPPEVTGHGYVWPSHTAKAAELAANATRIEGWRNTRSYYNFIRDLAAYYIFRPVKALDLQHLHDMLAKLRLGSDASGNIYLALCAAVQTEAEISQLLATVAAGTWDARTGGPVTGGAGGGQGLFYLGFGLLHPRLEVREAVASLLGRIMEHEAGRHFWGRLGRFMKVAWERVERGREMRLVAQQE